MSGYVLKSSKAPTYMDPLFLVVEIEVFLHAKNYKNPWYNFDADQNYANDHTCPKDVSKNLSKIVASSLAFVEMVEGMSLGSRNHKRHDLQH